MVKGVHEGDPSSAAIAPSGWRRQKAERNVGRHRPQVAVGVLAQGLDGDAIDATIEQARRMIRIYTGVMTLDETILTRIRQLMTTQLGDTDREGTLTNLRLVLAQLEKVNHRIAFWNDRLGALVEAA
jgi:hypothetical protein